MYMCNVNLEEKNLRKTFSQIHCEIFGTQCFFTNHLRHKSVNKTTCSTPSANPRQIKLSNCYDYFLRLSGFPDLLDKVFVITLKFPYLISQLLACKRNVNKTVQ